MTLFLALAAIAFQPQNPYARSEPLAIRSVTPNRTSVPRYGRLELTVDLAATYTNPFDPRQIDLYAIFTGPGGQTMRVNGFLDQPFTRKLEGNHEVLTESGPPVWKIRFAAAQAGAWRYRVYASDAKRSTVESPEGRFKVTASPSPGFIRTAKWDPAMFAYDNGKPFFAVGENLCWGGWDGQRGTYDYDTWLPALGKAGGNWIRIWMSSWNCALEWTKDPAAPTLSPGYHGVGVYNLGNAWKLDRILDTCAQNGIHVMLCFGTYGEFNTGGYFNEGQWKADPYNVANGGPCSAPQDFWTNETARKLYQQRLRYIAARWGDSVDIHSWEFWNEANAPEPWVAEMARCMKGTGEFAGKGADPYRHLVTTTYGTDSVWRIPEIDFTQTHNYGTGNIADHAPVVHDDALAHAKYGKPHLMGEFGIDWRSGDEKYDPQGLGINLHNAMWSAAASGDAGGAMIWYWDGYVHPKNLYREFASLRRFTDAVPWSKGVWKPLTIDPVRVESGAATASDLAIPAGAGWGKTQEEYAISPERGPSAPLPTFLYAPAKPDMRTTPKFHVRFERPGRFIVRVDQVSSLSRLRILLDGKQALEQEFGSAPGATGTYQKTEQNKEYGNWVATFGKEYGIDVPAGEHTITLDNVDGDWMALSEYRLTGYTSGRFPPSNCYALGCGAQAILWIGNGLHNWKNVFDKRPNPPIVGGSTAVHGLPNGSYVVEWWDTEKGAVLRRDRAACANGILPLRLPDLPTDIAARILPTSK